MKWSHIAPLFMLEVLVVREVTFETWANILSGMIKVYIDTSEIVWTHYVNYSSSICLFGLLDIFSVQM